MDARAIVSWAAYPALLLGALGAAHLLYTGGMTGSLAVMLVVFGATFPVLALQRWLPLEDRWRGRPSDFGIDVLHGLISGLAGDLWRALTFGVVFQISVWMAGSVGVTLWPTSWPLVAQLGLAMVVGDFGAYWVHRLCHTSPLLWRIHAMHHTSERLYALSATRSHPANVVLTWGSQALPLILLGCTEEVLVLMTVFTAVHGLLQHVNADLRHGWLNHVFATADLHRWHHSADIEESNANYSSNLILWDQVFGTRKLPTDRRLPDRAGLEGMAIPDNWFTHLALPFVLNRYALPDPEAADPDALDDFTLEVERPVPAELEPARE